MAKGTKIGDGYVEIKADTTAVDAATSAIPQKFAKMAASATAAGQQIRQGGMNGAMGLMLLSQTLDDMQYGLRAVVNNIPMLATAFGPALGMSTQAAMKFGAIAGIAAVAINVIVNHWDQLFQRFGYGTETMKMVWQSFWWETKDITIDALDAINARIKELESKPIKMAVDLHELEMAKEALKELQAGRQAWEQMGKGQGVFEKESGEQIKGLFGAMDAGELKKIQTDLVRQRADAMTASSDAQQRLNLTPEEEAKIRNSKRLPSTNGGMYGESFGGELDIAAGNAAVEAERQRRRDELARVREVNKQKAADELGVMLDKAQKGTDVAAQQQLAKALRDAGHTSIAEGIEASSPAEMERQAKIEADFERSVEGAHNPRMEAKQAEQDAIEQQGREYERNFQAKQRDKTRAEAGRFANALSPSVGKSLLQNGAMSDEELEGRVKKAMEKAGIAADVIGRTMEETAKKLREEMKEKISARALERGISEGAAAQQLLREQNEREKAQNAKEHPKAEILSTESYLNKVLVASLSTKGDEIPKDQLQAQRDALDKLDAIKDAIEKAKGAPVAARFAAKGAR